MSIQTNNKCQVSSIVNVIPPKIYSPMPLICHVLFCYFCMENLGPHQISQVIPPPPPFRVVRVVLPHYTVLGGDLKVFLKITILTM